MSSEVANEADLLYWAGARTVNLNLWLFSTPNESKSARMARAIALSDEIRSHLELHIAPVDTASCGSAIEKISKNLRLRATRSLRNIFIESKITDLNILRMTPQRLCGHCGASKLLLSGRHPTEHPFVLDRLGITHILCCYNQKEPDWISSPAGHFLKGRLVVPALDEDSYNIAQHFNESAAFVSEALQSSGSVLVHCSAGMHRSSTILAAVLVACCDLAVDEALATIKSARPMAEPTTSFELQLRTWASERIVNM